MKDDDGLKLDEKQITLFVEKFRALGLKDRLLPIDVVEVLLASFQGDLKEDPLEIARTICEMLEPERVGGIISLNCSVCLAMLDGQELANKADVCLSCTINGGEPK